MSAPLIDRDAMRIVLLEIWNDMAWDPAPFDPMEQIDQFTDAALKLARPVPTREQIVEVLHVWQHEKGSYPTRMCTPEDPCSSRRQIAEAQADAMMALLNGSKL